MILRINGMLDPHVHLRDLDWSHKATFASETAAALAGGYWAVLDMPNTPPPTIDRAALDLKRTSMARQAVCDWGLYFGAAQAGNQSEYAGAVPDVCGLKIYNNETTGTLLIEDQGERAKHYQAWASGKPIAVHAEGETVAQILELVRRYRRFTHFVHICTKYEIDLLRAAKAEGLPISIGVTPHHLYLTEDDLPRLGALGLMKPTLKTRADRDALWQALSDGLVDVVESDHAPHTLAEKQSSKPPYGVPGLETTLPLLCLAVEEGRLTYERLIDLVALNPQRIWGLRPDAETYTLVDTDAHYTIERANLRSACGWSPFEGMRVAGRVIGVWIRGKQVYDGENVLVSGGFGHDLAPTQTVGAALVQK
ncbi:MAG TPA: hypothetical protein VHD90_23685 [Phototrophicaceae bacterium]|nr:hypothetical protein [Phototrophicaceae bacterium]